MITTRELRLAAKCARKFLPVTLADVTPVTPPQTYPNPMPVGVIRHGKRFRVQIGKNKWKSFPTPHEAAAALAEYKASKP